MTRQQALEDVGNSAVPAHTPRLRLKPKAPLSGYVDGAWWPHSDDLTAELPDLLAVLSVRLGHNYRVLYNLNEWARAPKKLVAGGRAVRLDGYRLQPINTVEVLGLHGGRIVLLVVPPNTEPTHAHTILMAAAAPNDASTVDDLLNNDGGHRDGRFLADVNQERWETDGGTTLTPQRGSMVPN